MGGFSIESLVKASARNPWRVIFWWLALTALGIFFIGRYLGDSLTTKQEFTDHPESQQAQELIKEHFPERSENTELVIVNSPTLVVTDPAFRGHVTELADAILALGPDTVTAVTHWYIAPLPTLVSQNRHTTLVTVQLVGDLAAQQKKIGTVRAVLKGHAQTDFAHYLVGGASIGDDFQKVAEEDLQKGEVIGLPITLAILVIVFASVAAALIPIILGGVAIIAAIATVALVGQVNPFSFFIVNMITMMGLAVGIDYALFIISRYREERANHRTKEEAIARAGMTAARTVVFSGMTVVVALLGLLMIPMNVFQALSAGAIFVVVWSVVTALTLLPALLQLLGDRINWLRIGLRRSAQNATQQQGLWHRFARRVMRYPIQSLVLSVGILLAAMIPALSIKTGASGVESLPSSLETREAYTVLNREFSAGYLNRVMIAVEGDAAHVATQKALTQFLAALKGDSIFTDAQIVPSADGKVTLYNVGLNAPSTSDVALDAIARVRSNYAPTSFANSNARVFVGGDTAANYDFVQIARAYTKPVFSIVLGLSFLLLLVVFRSLVVPLKALIMNLLSVGAAYGLVVLVSQKGIGAQLLGFQQVEKIEAWIPLFLFCVLFGLSMDYHIFLLSRIRERFTQTKDNTEAVAFGVQTTARIITGAALIMVTVFGAFAAGELVMFQQMGFGLGAAVLLDATIVRIIVVPASMKLLGKWNWYLPKFLQFIPRIGIERS